MIESRICFADRDDVHAIEIFAAPIVNLFHHPCIGPVGGQKCPDHGRDLSMLPGDKNERVVVVRALLLKRGLQSFSIIERETHVDRQAKPYCGRLDRREWPNVVVKPAGILFPMRRIGSEDGVWPAKGFSDDRREC